MFDKSVVSDKTFDDISNNNNAIMTSFEFSTNSLFTADGLTYLRRFFRPVLVHIPHYKHTFPFHRIRSKFAGIQGNSVDKGLWLKI